MGCQKDDLLLGFSSLNLFRVMTFFEISFRIKVVTNQGWLDAEQAE